MKPKQPSMINMSIPRRSKLVSTLILVLITVGSSPLFIPRARAESHPLSKLESRQKLTHLNFYFHDIVTGPPAPTAFRLNPDVVDRINSSTAFGVLAMADNALTLGPHLNSTPLGRAQGIYAGASLTEIAFLMMFNLAFTHGDYNGSSLTLYGRNPTFSALREMPIVGGTGAFRFATGYAQANTYSADPLTFNAVVEYNVYVYHYY